MDGRYLAAALLAALAVQSGNHSCAGAQEFLQGSPFAEPPAQPASVRELGAGTEYEGLWGDPTDPKQAPAVAAATDCCRLCPCTYAVIEALILERNVSGTSFPLAVDATTGETLASTNDLDFPFSGGLRAYVGHRFCGCWAWELGYFGLFDATASTTITGDITLPGDLGPGTNVFFGADTLTYDYTSRLHGGELNFVCCCSCCETSCDPCAVPRCHSIEWIYGLRYLRVDESLTISGERLEVGGLETGSYNVRASNDLYGAQFGLRLRHCWGPWSLEGTGKLGIYGNDANTSQVLTDFPAFTLRQTSASDSDVALLAELNATLVRQISDHWFVRGGYNLIWIDGIALAPDQLDFTLASTSGTTIDTGNTMFLHGVNVGIEARW